MVERLSCGRLTRAGIVKRMSKTDPRRFSCGPDLGRGSSPMSFVERARHDIHEVGAVNGFVKQARAAVGAKSDADDTPAVRGFSQPRRFALID